MALIGNVQLVGGGRASLKELFRLLQEEGIQPGHPDVYVREYNSFGVEEARELSLRASSRAIASNRRVFIVIAPGMTSEAQNALLKTLEEPSGNALFFILVPSPHVLLPTLRSRAQILALATEDVDLLAAPAFLKAKPAERLEMLKPLLDKDEDEKRDLGALITFLSGLEQELSADPEKNRESLRTVYRARKFIGDKGALVKALLEQVALLA